MPLNIKKRPHFSSKSPVQDAEWLYDMYHSRTVWMNRALLSTVILAVLLALSLLTNVLLFPLKRQVPYLYAFDKATGEVTKLGALEPTQLSENWQMSRYFLQHYVMNRESYDSDNIEYPYQIAYAMTAPELRRDYDADVDSNNPASPYAIYGKSKYITVNVLAVSRLNDNTASIRFQKILHDRAAGTTQIAEREAIIKWHYQRIAQPQKLLDRNPLGFLVSYYVSSPVSLENPITSTTPEN